MRAAPFKWSFRNHVIPVMTKMGCNQGACHGALAGKNGFKLTLRGYDPEADYDTLTRRGGAARLADRAGSQPDSAQAELRHSARRRQAIRQGLAGISGYSGVDRGGDAAAGEQRRADSGPRSVSGVGGADARSGAADRGARAVLRRPHRGRDSLGEVQFHQRRRGDGGRLGPREDERRGRSRDHAVLLQPGALFAAHGAFPQLGEHGGVRAVSAPQLHRRPGDRQVEEPAPGALEGRG